MILYMCNKHKIQEILRYVWLPKLKLSSEELSYITDLICEILEGFGDTSNVNTLLNDISITKYNGSASSEKCEQVAELIMSWNGGPFLKTDYAVMRFRQSMYYTLLSYKNNEKELSIKFDMTVNYEVIIDPSTWPLDGDEKQQLLEIMQEIYKDELIIDNEENSEYITNNLAYW